MEKISKNSTDSCEIKNRFLAWCWYSQIMFLTLCWAGWWAPQILLRPQCSKKKTSNLLSVRSNVLLEGSHLQRKAESCHKASLPYVDVPLPKMQMSVFCESTTSMHKQECKSSSVRLTLHFEKFCTSSLGDHCTLAVLSVSICMRKRKRSREIQTLQNLTKESKRFLLKYLKLNRLPLMVIKGNVPN